MAYIPVSQRQNTGAGYIPVAQRKKTISGVLDEQFPHREILRQPRMSPERTPQTPEDIQRIRDRGETISQAPSTMTQRLVSKLPESVQSVGRSVKEGLFGNQRDRSAGLTLEAPLFARIKAEGFLPFLGRPQGERIGVLENSLIKRGVDPSRATTIATLDVLEREVPSIDLKKKDILKQELDNLDISKEEQKAIRLARTAQTLGSGLDAFAVTPIGSLRVSATGAKTIAQTKNINTITTILQKEVPNITEEGAGILAKMLVGVDNADDVQKVINISKFALQQSKKADDLPPLPKLGQQTPPQQAVRDGKYSVIHQGNKIKQVNGEPIKIRDDVDTFIHKDENGNWAVSEVTTGRNLTGGGYENKNFAIKAARENLNAIDDVQLRKLISENQLPSTPKAVKAVDDPLTLEARKYKSAEEFVEGLSGRSGVRNIEGVGVVPAKNVSVVKTQDFLDESLVAKVMEDLRSGKEVKAVILRPNTNPAISGAFEIVDGNHRLAAAQRLGVDIPVLVESPTQRFGMMAGQVIKNEGQSLKTATENYQTLELSQLTDIWERANKETTTKTPPTAQRILGQEKPRQITRGEDVALRERIRAEARGAKEGVRATKETIAQRRLELRALQNRYNLTDSEIANIRGRKDLSAMTDDEFSTFIKKGEALAQLEVERSEALMAVKGTIFEKELVKVENLRQAMKLPPMRDMNVNQLNEFNKTLEQFKQGDEFLSVRKLETVDNTNLKGIRTMREARESLIKDINEIRETQGLPLYTLDDLNSIKVAELDRYRYDNALARRNPFYELMVNTKTESFLNANANYLTVRDKIDTLIKSARKSRPRSLKERAIPTDRKVFEWLEANDQQKIQLAKNMTTEELEAGQYVRSLYADARDYLVQHQTLQRYQQDYITHIRRGFLEAWSDDGLVSAFREAFNQYKLDEAMFNIMNQKTGEVLPLEKFFRFSMRRSGELEPSKNVAKAVDSYFRAFEKKKALDSIVPKLDIYVHSLTPQKLTPRGLEFDGSLKTFVKEWVNTKKGRVADALVKPGGKIDWTLRTGLAFTRIIDLGLSVPIGIATSFGEQAANIIGMGTKNYSKGLARLTTPRGRAITAKYEEFVGEPLLKALTRATDDIGDKFMTTAFGLFQAGTRKANQVYLLGSLSPEEWAKGAISSTRLTQIQQNMGKYRVIPDSKSIIGSTAPGMVGTQYKTWAVPLVSGTMRNVAQLTRAIKNGGFTNIVQKAESVELIRSIVLMSAIGFGTYGLTKDNKKVSEMSFAEEIAYKSARDALSLIGALDPELFTSEPRLMQFLAQIGEAGSQILKLEENKDGELRGFRTLERAVTPAPVRQLQREMNNSGGMKTPDLPQLPKLPPLPPLPKF